VNAGWLLVLCIAVTIAGVDRLVSGSPRVEGLPVVAAAGIAAVVMAVGALILAGDPDDGDLAGRLNVRAVLLDTIGDAAAATGVAIAGVIILATGGNYWLDPLVALVIALVVGYHAASLIQQAVVEMRSRSGPSLG
jgi:cobalt-zinc-cadmium efflux system protein